MHDFILQTTTLSPHQSQQINDLWDTEYPAKLRGRFPLLLDGASQYRHYLILDDGNVAAWAADFYKDGELRFSIIVHPSYQGKGLGRQLIGRLRQENGAIWGWVIDHNNDTRHDGTPYLSPLPFYLSLGCQVVEDQRIDNALLSAVKVRL